MPTDEEMSEWFRGLVREDNLKHGRDPEWVPSKEERKYFDEHWHELLWLRAAEEVANQYKDFFGLPRASDDLEILILKRIKVILLKQDKREEDFEELSRLDWLFNFSVRSKYEARAAESDRARRQAQSKAGSAPGRALGIEAAAEEVLRIHLEKETRNILRGFTDEEVPAIPTAKKIWNFLMNHYEAGPYKVQVSEDTYEVFGDPAEQHLCEHRKSKGPKKRALRWRTFPTFQRYVTKARKELKVAKSTSQ